MGTAGSSTSEQTLSRIEALIDKGEPPTEKDFDELNAILQREPQNTRAHMVTGMAAEALKLPEQAMEQYDEAVKLSPNDPKPLVDLLFSRIRAGQGASCTGMIAMARKRFPHDPEIAFLTGWDAVNHKTLVKAQIALTEALKEKPDIPWLNATYADLMLIEGGYNNAYKYAKRELAKSPNNPKANYVAGMALAHQGRFADAIAYLGKSAITQPQNSELTGNLARISNWAGQYDKVLPAALAYLSVTVSAYTVDPQMKAILVDALRHTKKAQAMKIVDDFVLHFPAATSNAYFQNVLGEALAEVGWHQEARERFKDAIKIQPNCGIAQFNLGRDYELNQHDYAAALACYRIAKLTAPSELHVSDYAERLEERLSNRNQDLAWQLRDWMTGNKH
jgi:tetratricopeptide (TPR) repeat protein